MFFMPPENITPPVETTVADTHIISEEEHPEHPAHVDYQHYHRTFYRPPVKCYLCRRKITNPRSFFLVTPNNVLHVICEQCEMNLINIKHIDSQISLTQLGFPFEKAPAHNNYFVDEFDLEKISS